MSGNVDHASNVDHPPYLRKCLKYANAALIDVFLVSENKHQTWFLINNCNVENLVGENVALIAKV